MEDWQRKKLIRNFKNESYKNPPVGAAERIAPSLQYAFQHEMKPIAMAEF